MLYSINNIHTITQDTIEELKTYKNWGDALLLYFELCKHTKIQKTQNIRASEVFLERGLWWGRERTQNAKNTLKNTGLIELQKKQNKNGEIFYKIEIFVKIADKKPVDGKAVDGSKKWVLPKSEQIDAEKEANTVDGFAVDGKPVNGIYKNEKYLLDNKIIITEQKKEKQEIDNIAQLKKYINQWRMQDRFFYKIGDQDSYDRSIEEFFTHFEGKWKKLYSNTAEICFGHFLKPKWEKQEDRDGMILSYRRKFEKKINIDYSKKEIEQEDKKIVENNRKVEEIIANMSEEDREKLKNDSEKELLTLTKWRRGNESTFALLIRWRMKQKVAKKESLLLSI